MEGPLLDVRPFVRGRLKFDGELDRVDDALSDPVGLLSFLTERGSFDVEPETEPFELGGRREAGLRTTGRADLEVGTSLCDREWPFWAGSGWVCPSIPSLLLRLRYQLVGDEGSASGSDKLR